MQEIIDTITGFFDGIIQFFVNVFQSLKLFLIDLPVLIFEKMFLAVTWLFNWASESCAYCFSGTSSLPSTIQGSFNSLSASEFGSGVMYCLQQAQIAQCFQILTCGVLIWSVFKIISFIKSAVF